MFKRKHKDSGGGVSSYIVKSGNMQLWHERGKGVFFFGVT